MVYENLQNNRRLLIGRPNLTLKDIKCENITCSKVDKFKKFDNDSFICECGYILFGEFEIEKVHKIRLYCGISKCIFDKKAMDKSCLSCEHIMERQ